MKKNLQFFRNQVFTRGGIFFLGFFFLCCPQAQSNAPLGVFGGEKVKIGEHPEEINMGVYQPTLNMPAAPTRPTETQIIQSTVTRSQRTSLDARAVQENKKSSRGQNHKDDI